MLDASKLYIPVSLVLTLLGGAVGYGVVKAGVASVQEQQKLDTEKIQELEINDAVRDAQYEEISKKLDQIQEDLRELNQKLSAKR